MDVATEKPAQPRRRWFRFSLRTLLILVMVLSVPLGWVGWRLQQVHRERATIDWIEEMGGRASSNETLSLSERSWWEKTTEKWVGERIRYVSLQRTATSDLSPLAKLKNLKVLELPNAQVNDKQDQLLAKVLPNCKIIYSIRAEK